MQTFDFETAAYANFATPAAKAINVTSCRSSSQQSLAFCDNVPENGAFLRFWLMISSAQLKSFDVLPASDCVQEYIRDRSDD